MGGRHTRLAVGTARRRRTPWPGVRWLVLSCVILCGLLVALFAVRGTRILHLRHQLASSSQATTDAMAEGRVLQQQLAGKDDLSAIEDAARRLLGWVMPGDERVIFVDRNQTSAGGED